MSQSTTYLPTLLISADEVAQFSFEDNRNFKTAKIKGEVIVAAQEQWMRPVLGDFFYQYLIHAIQQEHSRPLSPADQRLWVSYIKPALAYYVKFLLLPTLSRPLTNMGLQALDSDHSRSVSSREIKSAQEATKTIADSLTNSLSRYLEQNKLDYPAYQSQLNIKKRVRVVGGIVLGQRKPRKQAPQFTPAPALPNQYTFVNTTNDSSWVFSYRGLLQNEGVQVAKIYDAQGNDITDYGNTLVNEDSQTVLIYFAEEAFLNPLDKTGSVLLMTYDFAQTANLVSAYIDIADDTATLHITEGTTDSPTYKWYIYRQTEQREALYASSAASINIADLFGTGYVRCEVWQRATRIISVFERFYRPLTDGLGDSIKDDQNTDISEL